jgi:TolB protein
MIQTWVQVENRRTQSDSRDANELWVCDLDGAGLRELTNRAGLQHSPAWDPHGGKIFYLSDLGPRGSHDIWSISPDGSEDQQLTFGELRHLDVAISIRGDIAYSGNQEGSYDVWLKAPAAMPVRLTDDPALDAHPSFSPDGEELLFESSRGGTLNIWRIPRSGGASVQVTHLEAPGARLPVWSPAEAVP